MRDREARLRQAVRYGSSGGAEALVKVVGGVRDELETETGASTADAAGEAKQALSVAARKELSGYPLECAGELVDLVCRAMEIQESEELVDQQLPFLLFEDLFHTHTVADFETIWSQLEARRQVLTSARILTSNIYPKMALMRICNYLLHRLSQSCNTEFCGRVQMFVASAMPLADRSGVNLIGEYNDQNVTDIETEADFDKGVTQQQQQHGGQTMDAKQVIGEQKAGETAINYPLYFKFWQLQEYFVSRPDKAPAGCASSVSNWTQFTETADVVLASFEAKPFSQADLERERAIKRKGEAQQSTSAGTKRRRLSDAGVDEDVDFFPAKYLTSSRLLKLQLSDPSLRRHVLVQFAFFSNSIKQMYRDSHASAGKGQKGRLGPAVMKKIMSDGKLGLAALDRRVTQLLKATPPDGPSFVQGLQQILAREDKWYKWKVVDRCKNYERAPDPEGNDDMEVDGEPSSGDKIAKAKENALASKERQLQASSKQMRGLWRSFELKSWKDTLSKPVSIPPFDEFIENMKIAIDPENGIEDDYHPRLDDVYCWRGFRLLSRANLNLMASVTDGSLENATKRLVGRHLTPKPSPEGNEGNDNDDQKQESSKMQDAEPDKALAEPAAQEKVQGQDKEGKAATEAAP